MAVYAGRKFRGTDTGEILRCLVRTHTFDNGTSTTIPPPATKWPGAAQLMERWAKTRGLAYNGRGRWDKTTRGLDRQEGKTFSHYLL